MNISFIIPCYNCEDYIQNNIYRLYKKLKSLKIKYDIRLKHQLINKNRSGDHIWYISDNSKFKSRHKNWKIKRNLENIIEEIVGN